MRDSRWQWTKTYRRCYQVYENDKMKTICYWLTDTSTNAMISACPTKKQISTKVLFASPKVLCVRKCFRKYAWTSAVPNLGLNIGTKSENYLLRMRNLYIKSKSNSIKLYVKPSWFRSTSHGDHKSTPKLKNEVQEKYRYWQRVVL